MAARKHDHLSSGISRWLIALADPMARAPLPAHLLSSRDLPKMLEAASVHGVLPAVTRNLRSYAQSKAVGLPSAQDIETALGAALSQNVQKQAALEQALTEQSERIAAAFSGAGIVFAMVKGDRFARRLYPNPQDRPFGDIDILIPVNDLERSRQVIPPLGFKLELSRARGGDENTMDKWVLVGNEAVSVETQTNLVHAPRIASKISLSYEQLLIAGRGNPEDATALLLAAAIHAAAIHQMDRLQHVIDVTQAVRGVAGPIDRESLQAATRETGSTVAVQTALDAAFQIFGENELRTLADQLMPAPWRKLRQKLLTPGVVIGARSRQSKRYRWRRRLARRIMTRHGRQAKTA